MYSPDPASAGPIWAHWTDRPIRLANTIGGMETSARDLRAAQVAHVLATAVRAGDVHETDALRIIRHELRRRNTNAAMKITRRSCGAQVSLDKYAPELPPKNGSPDSLHADHVYPLTADLLRQVDSLERWIEELARLRTVVCVTAAENYRLEGVERTGLTGPEKYAAAGVTFVEDLEQLA